MEKNQTADVIAKEYEQMAIAATNDYCRLKRQQPTGEFPAIAKQIGFCTTMANLWKSIDRKLADGPEMYQSNSETTEYWKAVEPKDYYDEFGL